MILSEVSTLRSYQNHLTGNNHIEMPPTKTVATLSLIGRTTAKLNCEEMAAHPRRSHQPGYDLHTKVVRNSGYIVCARESCSVNI